MGPLISSTTRPARDRYLAIDLATLRVDRLLNFDLYIDIEGEKILYREKSLEFTESCRRRLLDGRVQQIYIDERQRLQFLGYMEKELPLILTDQQLATGARAGIAYSTSRQIIEDIFDHPSDGDYIRRSETLVDCLIRFLADDKTAFLELVKASDEDYNVHSHSVNVCISALGLAREIGIRDEKVLHALGVGAILHDIGKTRIDARVMRKRTPLSREEYELMKKHVELGIDVLRESNVVPEGAYAAVWQHQEREDGSGYPRGLHGPLIHLFGKITAIADTFDAMTSNRVYRKGITAFDTFRSMQNAPLDQVLLRQFIRLLGPA